VTLPVASAGRLLFYTEDGHSFEDVLVVNPLTGEQKILGVPTLDSGAPASLEEAQTDGDDHENGDDPSEVDADDGSVVISYESELDEISDSGRSEWDEEESADGEGIMLLKPFKIPNQGTECDSKLAEHAASAKMNLDGLSCMALPPNKELEAGETLLEEEFPTTLNQSVGANAEVGNLKTEKSDNDDHLKAQEETSFSDQDRLQVITVKLLLNLACTVHNRPPKLAPNSADTMLTFSAEII
jgi:hypothetical protein